MIIYLSGEDIWFIEKNIYPSWSHLVQVYNIKNKIKFKINEKTYNYLLKLDSLKKYEINNCKNIRQVFQRWELIDQIGEELI
jgi:hypothetical protein